MKIFRDGVAHVQKADLVFWFSHSGWTAPTAIAEALFRASGGSMTINDREQYDFTLIADERGMKALRSAEWIDDFEVIDKMSENDIVKRGLELVAEANNKARTFDAYSDVGQKVAAEVAAAECRALRHQAELLVAYLIFRKGKAVWKLPREVTSVSARKPTLMTMTIRQIFEFI